MSATLRSLKRTVEILTGQVQGTLSAGAAVPNGAVMAFIGATTPANSNNTNLNIGDFWIQVLDQNRANLFIWTGARWKQVSVA